jgi:hypothetical protein
MAAVAQTRRCRTTRSAILLVPCTWLRFAATAAISRSFLQAFVERPQHRCSAVTVGAVCGRGRGRGSGRAWGFCIPMLTGLSAEGSVDFSNRFGFADCESSPRSVSMQRLAALGQDCALCTKLRSTQQVRADGKVYAVPAMLHPATPQRAFRHARAFQGHVCGRCAGEP